MLAAMCMQAGAGGTRCVSGVSHLNDLLDLWDVVHQHVLDATLQGHRR
jgi:hypothetical protein